MKRVLFKVIVPTVFIAVWMWTCYLICNKTEGFDWFLYWILAGCPFGIRRMCLWLIPKNFGISGSIGVLALNCIAGGLIGGIVLIFKIISIVVEVIRIVSGNFWTKSQRRNIEFLDFVQRMGSQGMTAHFIVRKEGAKRNGVNERCE